MPLTRAEFDALVDLIQAAIYYREVASAHPNDIPRVKGAQERWEQDVADARDILEL